MASAEDVLIEITDEMHELFKATEEATQAIKELSAEMEKFKKMYHPVVWFLLRLGLFRNNG